MFVFIIFWWWLIYADRLHLREVCRQIGKKIRENINVKISQKNKELIEKYVFYQLNTISECIAGFTNGLIFDEPTINITLMIDKETNMENNSNEIEIQTDPVEPEIKIVEKEVMREILVVKEIQVPVPMNMTNSSTIVNTNNQYDIFEKKSHNNNKPSMVDDTRADYDTMIENKTKRVRVKQKKLNAT